MTVAVFSWQHMLVLILNLGTLALIAYAVKRLVCKEKRGMVREAKQTETSQEKTLGEKIKELREKRNITQEMVAERLGVSRQAVSKWEKNTSQPSTSNLMALAELFGVPVETLVGVNKPRG